MGTLTYTDIHGRRFIVYLLANVSGGTYILSRPCGSDTHPYSYARGYRWANAL